MSENAELHQNLRDQIVEAELRAKLSIARAEAAEATLRNHAAKLGLKVINEKNSLSYLLKK